MQARDGPFAGAVGRVDGGAVGRFAHVLADDVDAAFPRRQQVAQRVFGVAVAAGEADDEEWWVLRGERGVRGGGGGGGGEGGDERD